MFKLKSLIFKKEFKFFIFFLLSFQLSYSQKATIKMKNGNEVHGTLLTISIKHVAINLDETESYLKIDNDKITSLKCSDGLYLSFPVENDNLIPEKYRIIESQANIVNAPPSNKKAPNPEQFFHFGIKVGLNSAWMRIPHNPEFTRQPKYDWNGGFNFEYRLSKHFSLEHSIEYSSKGIDLQIKASSGGITLTKIDRISPDYIVIPINILYKINFKASKLFFYTGAYYAYGFMGAVKIVYHVEGDLGGWSEKELLDAAGLYNASRKIVFGNNIATDDIKREDYGYNLGIAFLFARILEYRLQFSNSLVNLDPESSPQYEMRNKVITFTMGLKF